MIKNYSLFYKYKLEDDFLSILLSSLDESIQEKRLGNIGIYEKNGIITRVKLYNFKEIVKIKIDGIIYLPNPLLIDVINAILKNAGLDTLEYKNHSGYWVSEIIKKDENGYLVNVGSKNIYVSSQEKLANKTKIVICEPHTIIDYDRVYDKYHICDELDLKISSLAKPFIVEENIKVGTDFFLTEVK